MVSWVPANLPIGNIVIHLRVDPANADVIKAVDFVGHDGYPFWQGSTIPQSAEVLWQSIAKTREAANKVKVSSTSSTPRLNPARNCG
jgi:exo-beta-1,3-glucanase (GH17 family)